MTITRKWCMPNKWTFQMKPVKELLQRYVINNGDRWADPFCGQSAYAEYRNDLDPNNGFAQSNKMAVDFLSTFLPNSLNGVLFDPPYSPRQMSECYKSVGLHVNSKMTQGGWPEEKNHIARIVKPGGLCISFGWNSNGIGKKRGFEIIEILLIAHGGGHNDSIVTVERKL